jgi:hypothetical protein
MDPRLGWTGLYVSSREGNDEEEEERKSEQTRQLLWRGRRRITAARWKGSGVR